MTTPASATATAKTRFLWAFQLHLFWLLLALLVWLPVGNAFQYASTTSSPSWLKPSGTLSLSTLESVSFTLVGPLYGRKKSSHAAPEDYGSNLQWLKEEYNQTEEWLQKRQTGAFHAYVGKMNSTKIIEKIEWLQRELKLSKAEIGQLLAIRPDFVIVPSSTTKQILSLLRDELNMTNANVRKFIFKQPQILASSVKKIERNVNWLRERLQLNTTSQVERVIQKDPDLLHMSVTNNLEPTFRNIRERLGLDDVKLLKVVTRATNILLSNYTTGIEPTIACLEEVAGVQRGQAGNIVYKFPHILSKSSVSIKSNAQWLQKRLGMNQEEVQKVIRNFPQVLSLDRNENIEPKLQWFERNLELHNLSQLRRLIVLMPQLLGTSVSKNLQPTLDFFEVCLGHEKATEFLRKFPTGLGYSLDGRLKPRLQQWEELQVSIDAGVLMKMCTKKDEDWERILLLESRVSNQAN